SLLALIGLGEGRDCCGIDADAPLPLPTDRAGQLANAGFDDGVGYPQHPFGAGGEHVVRELPLSAVARDSFVEFCGVSLQILGPRRRVDDLKQGVESGTYVA